MRLMITRPQADAGPLAALLAARGVETMIEPMLHIAFAEGPPPSLQGVQAVLATSANGVRALARRIPAGGVPVAAVGAATAEAAREAGFAIVATAGGDVESLADVVRRRLTPDGGALLHVAGSAVAGDLGGVLRPSGFTYRRVVLYDARPAERLSETASTALRRSELDGVVLYSPRTARIFGRLVAAAGLSEHCRELIAFCLSDAVARAAAALEWRRVAVAACPDQASMVALIDAGRRGA